MIVAIFLSDKESIVGSARAKTHVKLLETMQILRSAGSSQCKGLSSLRQSEPVGDQVPEVPCPDSGQLDEMQFMRTHTVNQLPEVWEAHFLR